MTFSRFFSRTCRACWSPNLTRTVITCSRLLQKTDLSSNEDLIVNNTVISSDHLTPEIQLRLITPECELWHCKSTESKFENDPFWGIYWPGGQALGRYILDNRELFHEKNVLDIGSGSGGCAIAAAKCGAKTVLANDIDPISLSAIQINARLNDVKVFTEENDLIGKDIDALNIAVNDIIIKPKWNVVLIGDMFYDTDFSSKLFTWLCKLVTGGKMVLVGDPGRHALKELNQMTDYGIMIQIAEYCLTNMEHNGFAKASVYKMSLDRYLQLNDLSYRYSTSVQTINSLCNDEYKCTRRRIDNENRENSDNWASPRAVLSSMSTTCNQPPMNLKDFGHGNEKTDRMNTIPLFGIEESNCKLNKLKFQIAHSN